MTTARTTTKAALLQAAAEVIAERGWHAANARAVADRAGVPLGAVNYHFDGKEDLLRQAAIHAIARMYVVPTQMVGTASTLRVLLDRIFRWHRSPEVSIEQQVLVLEVMLQSRRDPRLAAMFVSNLQGYRAFLAEVVHRTATHLPPGSDTGAVVDALSAALDGLMLHFLIDRAFPLDEATAMTATAWRALLQP